MSFSAEWLALREPVDHRSVDAGLREAVAARFPGSVRLLDLGCGSGSNLRGLAPSLGADQCWTLVDWDAALLAHASAALTAWAEDARDDDAGVQLRRDGRRIRVDFLQADLAADFAAVLDEPVDLVTAAAFFDLVSEAWIDAFCDALAARRLPLYTVLTYDGRETWSPPHPADAAVLAAFHAHQGGDKGFGPAAGPRAAQALTDALRRRGYTVATAPSPWRLAAPDASLIADLAAGSAAAAAEAGLDPALAESWRAARIAATGCEIGHVDVFAYVGE